MNSSQHEAMAEKYLRETENSIGNIYRKEGDVPDYYEREIRAGQAFATAAHAHAIMAILKQGRDAETIEANP